MAKEEKISDLIKNLPQTPGIYKYFDKAETLIYVGKAKNLKKRVSSYFSKIHTDNKTRSLVSQIEKLEFIVVDSEADALLLENNLIKINQPKYNILLRDDKTYPYLLITNDRFPKVYATRKFTPEKGKIYGPFTSVGAMYSVLELIKKLFTIRSCDLKLTEANIKAKKFKACLEYHIGNCKAPCENLQSEEDYIKDIEQVKVILKGDLSIIKKIFVENIKTFASNLEFEKAEKLKNKLYELDKYQSHSLIQSAKDRNLAVFTLQTYETHTYINYVIISFGRITESKTFEAVRHLDETDEEVLSLAVYTVYEKTSFEIEEIITNLKIDYDFGIPINTPQRGDKKGLVELSLKNIDYYIQNKALTAPHEPAIFKVLEILQNELSLKELPTHIECFDNSNLQGTNPVAAMVCYKNGVPSKKDWRHFNIKTVVGPDDFGSMKEIVFRRYSRLKNENQPFPKLIVIDGGKGQLSSAVESLKELDLYGVIPIISIAKRLEEIYVPGDELPILLKKTSASLRLLQKIRDDTHDFAINFHRLKRSNASGIKKKK